MWVYILFSKKLGKHYVGYSIDWESRLNQHNAGMSQFTRSGMPWAIIYKEYFKTRTEARKREKQIKSYKGGNAFKKLLGEVAERSKARGC